MLKLVILTVYMSIFGGERGGAFAVDERIVGGTVAEDGAYPYQVSLRTNNGHFCGASIISPYWILTVAHCIQGLSPQNIHAFVGTNYLDRGGYAYQVVQLILHEYYNSTTVAHDIGVLRVNTPITYTSRIQPIGLSSTTVPGGLKCVLTGWGLTGANNTALPNSLLRITLTTISLSECLALKQGYDLYTSHVCTNQGSGYGACMGDSGGALVCGSKQVGVVSWVIPCARGYPDIFCSVAYYRSWITKNTGV